MSDSILAEYWYHESLYRDKGVTVETQNNTDIDCLLYDYWNYLDSLHKTNCNNAIKLVA